MLGETERNTRYNTKICIRSIMIHKNVVENNFLKNYQTFKTLMYLVNHICPPANIAKIVEIIKNL